MDTGSTHFIVGDYDAFPPQIQEKARKSEGGDFTYFAEVPVCLVPDGMLYAKKMKLCVEDDPDYRKVKGLIIFGMPFLSLYDCFIPKHSDEKHSQAVIME